MHEHSHDEDDETSRNLGIVAIVNFIGFLIELSGGILFGSVSLLSDAFHMLFDMLAYTVAFLAAYVAQRYGGGDDGLDYATHRIEPLAAFVNGLLLIPMVGYIIWTSYQRFISPIEIETVPVLGIAIFGLMINIGSVYILEGDNLSLNEKGAFYHLLGDAGGSVAVIISVIVIHFTGNQMIDPIVATLIGILILWSAGKILMGSGFIFMHRSPVDRDKIRNQIEELELIKQLGCVHSWQICSQIDVATVHAISSKSDEKEELSKEIHRILHQNGVDHATVEVRDEFEHDCNHLLHQHNH